MFSIVESSPSAWTPLYVDVSPQSIIFILLSEISSESKSNPLPPVALSVVFAVPLPIMFILSSTSTFSV